MNHLGRVAFLVGSSLLGVGVGSLVNRAIVRIPRNIPIFSRIPLANSADGYSSKRSLLVVGLTGILYGIFCWYVLILNGPQEVEAPPLLSPFCLLVYWPLLAALILVSFVDMQDYEETEEEKARTQQLRQELEEAGIDADMEMGPVVYGIIPNEVTYTGLILAVPLALFFPETHWNLSWILPLGLRFNAVLDVFLGALTGGALTWALGIWGKLLFKKAAMGLGDVKLMAMLGALLGWKAILLIFFLAPLFGTLFGIVQILRSGEHYLRYAPCIALAVFLVLLYEPVATAYFDVTNEFALNAASLHHRVPFLSP